MGKHLQPVRVVTQEVAGSIWEVHRYVQDPSHNFDPICLDTDALARHGLIEGEASAGRGNTVFFNLHDKHFVLRHYRRGGLVRYVSTMHYLFTGLNRTRAMREFDLLLVLQQQGLPAPVPYACSVLRRGLLYTASLVTYRLPGKTLAERLLCDGCLSMDREHDEHLWGSLGELIARFHAAGVSHADLNAHNIMLDDDERATLIDFDRGRIRPLPGRPAQKGWCLDNIDRLERSLRKIAGSSTLNTPDADALAQKFSFCREQWSRSVTLLACV